MVKARQKFRTEALQLVKNLGKAAKISWRIDRRNTLCYAASMLLQVVTSIAALYFAGRVITELFNIVAQNSPIDSLVRNFILSAAFLTLEQVAWRLMNYFQSASFIVWHTQISPVFAYKIASLDIARFEDPEFSKLINKVSQDYAWKPANFVYHGFNAAHGLLRLLGTAIALLTFSPLIVLIVFVILLPSLAIEARQSRVKWSIWELKGDASRRHSIVSGLLNNKQDIIDIRVFGLLDYLVDYLRRMLDDFNQEQQKVLKRFVAPAILIRLGEGAVIGGVNFWLISRVINGTLQVGQYSFYSGMVNQFNSSLGIVLSSLSTLYDYNLYMTDYFEFMETPSLLPQATEPKILTNKVPEIKFENVSFKYPHSDRQVFKNLSLTVKPGESIALVGVNGAGKSTLIKLLLRLYDVDEGAILIDGVNIKDLDINSWYKHLSALLQDFTRYPFTIQENIHFGRVKKPLDSDRLAEAVKLGGVNDFVHGYAKGLDTILDSSFEEGVEPSGGQWQRVALARAFYRHANVLILDEPTAAIDANAEYEIFKNITSSQQEKTTIIVSHRFSTVRTADHIYVIDKGRIKEHGSHAQLLKQGGVYATMFHKQAEGYK
ncbi:MAG: ABC transporter ATP-binding protein/permease [Candidatus Saccharibacteria bacterium]|nr:ABC transporter ATP-binding protein/permease [Candidatus Saccharibacteria bacterium]